MLRTPVHACRRKRGGGFRCGGHLRHSTVYRASVHVPCMLAQPFARGDARRRVARRVCVRSGSVGSGTVANMSKKLVSLV